MMGSYGRVSRYGLIAFASSLDRIGPLASKVRDVASVLEVIAGRDPLDSTSTTAPVPDYGAELGKPLKRPRLGVPKEYFAEVMNAKVRTLIAEDFRDAFSKADAILTPTSPVPPFQLGERTSDPLQMYLADIYTVTGSLAGVPGISVPCGKIDGQLPVGLQIFGPPFGEARILQLAHAFEQAGGAEV